MKQLLTFFLLSFSYILCGAQAISLIVDNQTPGWLSSKINYGDQKTVESLTVTGYINFTDLSFIGSLMQKQKLNKLLDLSDTFIIGDVGQKDNDISYNNIFNIQGSNSSVHIDRLELPKSITTPTPNSNTIPLKYIQIDTLIYGGDQCPIFNNALWGYWAAGGSGANSSPKHLVLREGVTTIDAYACDNNTYNSYGGNVRIETVSCPNSMQFIGKQAFRGCNQLYSFNFSDNIEVIQELAFEESSFVPDTLKLPQSLIEYHTNSFPIIDGQVIELGSNVSSFDNESWYIKRATKVIFIINRNTPPRFKKGFRDSQWTPSFSDGTELSGCTLYVPKDGYTLYTDPKYDSVGGNTWSGWSNPYSHAMVKTIPIKVTGIVLNHNAEILNVGNVLQISAEMQPTNADNKTVIWSSSNSDIANVDKNGLVTAISSGKVLITATSQENSKIFASCEIIVHQPLQTISLRPTEICLKVGETFDNMTVTYYPTSSDNKAVIWSSSNESVAQVDANGKVTAIYPGEAKITITSVENPEIKDECTVSVVQPATGIILNQNSAEITVDGSLQLIATVIPDNSTNKNVSWSSSDVSVAMVSGQGIVYGIKPGQATIMATTEDGDFSALCKITVKEGFIPISEITLSQTTIDGNIGDSYTLTASILPENASNKTLVYQSDNESVASVDNKGFVRMLNSGVAIITVSATDGSEVYSKCKVTVNNIVVTSITLSSNDKTMTIGDEFQLIATILPDNATCKNVEWRSSNESIATVNNQGIVKALKQGECVISVIAMDGSGVTASCKIKVDGTSAIEDILVDKYDDVGIFSIQGLLLFKGKYAERPHLKNGIYIVRTTSGKVFKLTIKN